MHPIACASVEELSLRLSRLVMPGQHLKRNSITTVRQAIRSSLDCDARRPTNFSSQRMSFDDNILRPKLPTQRWSVLPPPTLHFLLTAFIFSLYLSGVFSLTLALPHWETLAGTQSNRRKWFYLRQSQTNRLESGPGE